jgi:hypothetical protein
MQQRPPPLCALLPTRVDGTGGWCHRRDIIDPGSPERK